MGAVKEACLAVDAQAQALHRIMVVGIGPGNPNYMVPAARKAIARSEALVGGERALAQFAQKTDAAVRAFASAPAERRADDGTHGRQATEQESDRTCRQETCVIKRDIGRVMAFIREHLAETDVVVMVSGDPGYFSLLDAIRRTFPAELIDVIPGISSFQLAFARLALPWHDADLLSFHGRVPEDGALAYRPGRKLGMLTDMTHNSRTIAKTLLAHGWPESARYAICARLSYEDERIERLTIGEAVKHEPVGSCIVVVEG